MLHYVFHNQHGETDYNKLEENTRLQKAFKKLLLDGKQVYDTRGIIPFK